MSNELAVAGLDTASTAVAHVRRDSDERVWCVTHAQFEIYSDAEFGAGNYDVPLAEQGTSGYFVGDMPGQIAENGFFNISFYTIQTVPNTNPAVMTRRFETAGTITFHGAAGEPQPDEPVGLNWVTRERYKTLYGSQFDDAQIDVALTVASAMCNSYLGRTIRQTAHAEVHQLDGRAINLRSYPVQSITRITFDAFGNDPKVYDGSNFVVNEVGTVFPKFGCGGVSRSCCRTGFCKVEYVGGYGVVPSDLQWCVMEVANNMMAMADPDFRVTSRSAKDISVQYAVFASDTKDALFKDAKGILDTYKMPVCI